MGAEVTRRKFLSILGCTTLAIPILPKLLAKPKPAFERAVVDVTHAGSPGGYREFVAADHYGTVVKLETADRDVKLGDLIVSAGNGKVRSAKRRTRSRSYVGHVVAIDRRRPFPFPHEIKVRVS